MKTPNQPQNALDLFWKKFKATEWSRLALAGGCCQLSPALGHVEELEQQRSCNTSDLCLPKTLLCSPSSLF